MEKRVNKLQYTLIKNTERKMAMVNIRDTAKKYCQP